MFFTVASSQICAPSASAERASPLTSFPGSPVPPGTSRTARRSPESVQAMGESGNPSFRPSSQTPGSARSQSSANSFTISESPASTSPNPGTSPAAVSDNVMPPVWPLEPAPTRQDSNRATLLEGSSRRSQAAAESPENPPPTTAKSTSLGIGLFVDEKSIFQGGLPQEAFWLGPA